MDDLDSFLSRPTVLDEKATERFLEIVSRPGRALPAEPIPIDEVKSDG